MGQVGDLEQQLARLWRESAQAWPELELPVDDFLPHVARRMRRDLPPGQRLVHARGPDLFLACACASGVERAIATCRPGSATASCG
jgi:hypothetical protein